MFPILAQQSGGFQQTVDKLARTPLSQIVIFVAVCSLVRIALYKYLKTTLPHHRHGVFTIAKFINEAMDAVVYAGVFVFMLIRPFAVQAFLIPSGSMEQTLWVNDFIVANKAIYRYSEPKVGDIIVFKPPARALNKDQGEEDFIKRCQGTPGDIVEVRQGKLFRNGKAVTEPYLSDSPGDHAGSQDSANGNWDAIGAGVEMRTDWKLIHYLGKARPGLYDQYIPVQIRRDGEPEYNYGVNTMICHEYAVGSDDDDPSQSAVMSWKSPLAFSQADRDFEKELKDSPPAAVPKGFVLMMGDNRNNSYDGRAWGLVARDDVIGRAEFIWLPISRWRMTR